MFPMAGSKITSRRSSLRIPAHVSLNPKDAESRIVLSNGNRTVFHTGGQSYSSIRATRSVSVLSNGYFEAICTAGGGSFPTVGVANSAMGLTTACGNDANSWAYYSQNGASLHNGSQGTYGSGWSTGAIIGCAYALGQVWFSLNGVWQSSGDPANGINPAFTGITGLIFPCISVWDPGTVFTARFRRADFSFAPPSGFSPWGN